MTSRQRWLALLRGEPTDRIGIQVRGVDVWKPDWCAGKHASFGPLIDAVRAHGDWEAMIGIDSGLCYSSAEVPTEKHVEAVPGHEDVAHHVTVIEGPGGPLRQTVARSRVGHPPMTVEHLLKTPEDAENLLALPYEPVRPDPQRFVDLDRAVGDRGLVLIILGYDAIGEVYELLGTERLAIWSIDHRDLLHRMLEEFSRRRLDVIRYLGECGLAERMPLWVGHVGAELVVPPLASPTDFRDFVVRYDRPLHDAVHDLGGFVHVHSHGSICRLLEDFADMGADVLHPVEAPPLGDTPLAEAKRRIGDRVTIEGNVEISRVLDEEPDAFRRRVRQTIADGKPGGRFVICPTASPYPVELSDRAVENYLSLIDIAMEEGRY
jgi:uroporphyrinogen decarboxylase-like protein